MADPAAAGDELGPRGFRWLIRGRLGGTPRPGTSAGIEADLAALRRVGATVLYSLTQEWAPPAGLIRAAGLRSVHLPIPDMSPPSVEQAARACREIADHLRTGEIVVHHCHAGRGRTGTMLACQLIWHGQAPSSALASVRAANRNWIETAEQEAFLAEFAQHCRAVPDAG